MLPPAQARAADNPDDIPDGIPRALAQSRAARVSGLHYQLSYTLIPHAPATVATETLRFTLTDASTPLLLDFRDGQVSSLTLNGSAISTTIDHGHLILPADHLHDGPNTDEAHFTVNIGAAGKAITRFEDHDDGSEYLYTLFVPMDASMAFPCFDQPDLKARFTLTVSAPKDWTVISNTAGVTQASGFGQAMNVAFSETQPLPTYLFAFAAGPFVSVHSTASLPNVWVRKSKAPAALSEVPAVQTTAADGIKFLSNYFAQPFPFPKYEMVLIPGFAYGGMEHAGCTFLREESVLFRTAPTDLNRFARQTLVLHELTHQWFGDFTTMRWFDDLWLKEGFAQYMAYKTLAALHPDLPVWQRFYQSIKPGAYAIDETQGTTPIYQDIPNLNAAKSAYGAIVYSKAPGVLRQLNYVIGDEAFRHGLQLYLAAHQYGNATWSDLIDSFHTASGRDLTAWADIWIRHRGMPRVDVAWSCSGSQLSSLRLTQTPVLAGPDSNKDLWPIATEVLLAYPDGTTSTLRADLGDRSVSLDPHKFNPPLPCPAWIFANNNDHAYGLFPLDAKSREAVMHELTASAPATSDVFRRTLLWGSLWDSVRLAELNPADYIKTALDVLPHERDEALASSLLGRTQTAIHRYVPAPAQPELLARGASLAADRMTSDPDHDLRIVWFRALDGFATQPAGAAVMKDLLSGKRTIPGVELRQQDRWSLVTALLAYNDPEADTYFAAEQKRDPSGDGLKYAWIAQAARPDAATKQRYFADYTRWPAVPSIVKGEEKITKDKTGEESIQVTTIKAGEDSISEDWIQSSLGAFNYWNQSELTAPFLQPALDALPEVKRERKIFFLVAWLDAFIDGQQSQASLDTVNHYLQTANPDPDLRLKVLEAMDELQRTVKIRAKFTNVKAAGINSHEPVLNAPYSAKRRFIEEKKLADGTISRSESGGSEARDSQGRTYSAGERQWTYFDGRKSILKSEMLYRIDDPVANTETRWNSTSRIVKVIHWSQNPSTQVASAVEAFLSPPVDAVEKLGAKTIGGLVAEGSRSSYTVSPGQDHNDQPIMVVHETWSSPELKIVILETNDDPRSGKTRNELADIVRGEPDVTQYRPPADYVVRELQMP
jgi:aminopeptidase N